MNLLSDIITYIRRIIKSPSDSVISDNLIIDYINRFWIMDVDARVQLFDLKTVYQFQTQPGVDQYNMPLYSVQTQPGAQTIASFPVYQGFMAPFRVNGVVAPFYTQRSDFLNIWPNFIQPILVIGQGDGTASYTFNIPFLSSNTSNVNPNNSAILRGHIDITGIISTGNNQDPPLVNAGPSTNLINIPTTSVFPALYFTTTDGTGANAVVSDSGQFLNGNVNYGLLLRPGAAPFGNVALNGGYSITSNTINYTTGVANVTFTDSAGGPLSIPSGMNINCQCYFYETGLPRACLFYNNVLTLRVPPNSQYLVELDAYLSPAAFLNTGSAIPFGYMAEYIARGAARKILADTGDTEQFMFYEPLFREQEILVWKRSQRQFTATRTETIYSQDGTNSNSSFNQSIGQV